MRHDLRLALRFLRNNPGFCGLVILVLALGLGANTALFGVVDGVLFRPLRLEDPGRLVQVERVRADGSVDPRISNPAYLALREGATLLEGLTAVWDGRREAVFAISGADERLRVRGARVSADFFAVLRPVFAIGGPFDERTLAAGEGDRIAVLSHRIWQRAFGADPSILSKTIRMNGEVFEVVGVLSPEVDLPRPQGSTLAPDAVVEVWTPLPASAAVSGGDYDRVVARLDPEVTVEAATSQVSAIISATDELEDGSVIRLTSLQERLVGDNRNALFLFSASLAVLLLLTCINVAGLQLARTLSRRSEMSVRAALGAGPFRLARRYLVEGLVLSTLGGAAGLVAAVWLQRLIVAWAPAALPRSEAAHLGPRVMTFTLVAAVVAGVVCSIAPMVEAFRTRVTDGLHLAARSTTIGRRGRRLRGLVAASQIALAVVLLSGTALLVRSLWRLADEDIGYRPGQVAAIDLYRDTFDDPAVRTRAMYAEILDRIRDVPGVRAASMTSSLPGRPRDYFGPGWRVRVIADEYFELLGIRFLQGRGFAAEDRSPEGRAAILSQSLARQEFGDESPIGREFDDYFVVGVVADARHERADRAPLPALYLPVWQRVEDRLTLLVDSDLPPRDLTAAVRSIANAIDADQPVGEATSLERILAESSPMAERTFYLRLLGTLGLAALGLALLGVYGAVAQLVVDARREFGVRMAFGASPTGIGSLVLRRGLATAIMGVVAGLATAAAATGILGSLVYEVSPLDPATALAVVAVVVGASVIAVLLPARRATRVSPLEVLRLDP